MNGRGRRSIKPYFYFAVGSAMLAFSFLFLLWSVSYMEVGKVATSLISALAGLSLLTSSLYLYRIAAYVYAAEKGE